MFLPDGDKRRLWRNAIALFYKKDNARFEGPFSKAGYRLSITEGYFGPEKEDRRCMGHNPDIVAISGSRWMCLELTTGGIDKSKQLEAYRRLHPGVIASTYAQEGVEGEPDVICASLRPLPPMKFCHLIINSKLEVDGEGHLSDKKLRECLRLAVGNDLSNSADIKCTFFPEMTERDIRIALISHVLQLFKPGAGGMTAEEMVKEGLGELDQTIGPKGMSDLRQRTAREMDMLQRDHLSEYLAKNGIRYQSKVDGHHPSTLEKINRLVVEWSGQAIVPPLEQFEKVSEEH
jgi:hypothetical protein